MNKLFIIGLPKQLRGRLEQSAARSNVTIYYVPCGIGKRGSYMLLPFPKQAIHDLRGYIDSLDEISEAVIYVLKYADIPYEVSEELEAIEEMGGSVNYIDPGTGDWPVLKRRTRPDDAFLNRVYQCIEATLSFVHRELPSEYFRALRERNARVFFSDQAMALCDAVASHRRGFLIKASEAFEKMVDLNGQVGRIDLFFSEFGIEFAKTGGIKTTLTIIKDGHRIYKDSSQVHLKQGDNTTPQAAARVYFHSFSVGDAYYVAVTYAGPHPESDLSMTWHWD